MTMTATRSLITIVKYGVLYPKKVAISAPTAEQIIGPRISNDW
jgi:hypothetical protein